MQRIAITYGSISGLIIIVSVIVSLLVSDPDQGHTAQWFGYLTMLIALSAIFFGVKRHRDIHEGGSTTFWKALQVGLFISLVASGIYIVVWEVYLAVSGSNFYETYADAMLAQQVEKGLAGAELEAKRASMEQWKERLANPLIRVPVTFTEIFPVGLFVSLVSAAILRNDKILPAKG